MHIKKILFFTFIFLFSSLNIFAHPHMAIFSSCEFSFDDSELKGIWINYRFDQYFSVSILNDYDLDKDNQFNTGETEMVYNNAFINLKNYGFFISIRNEDGRTSPEEVSDFSISTEGDILTYHFYIKVDNSELRELYLAIYDSTFFCATYYEENNPVKVLGDSKIQTDFSIVENTDYPVFYNPYASASDNDTYTKWEPGLETFYPEEIHFVY